MLLSLMDFYVMFGFYSPKLVHLSGEIFYSFLFIGLLDNVKDVD